MNQSVIDQIAEKVRLAMQGIEPGHDFSHISRVLGTAMSIQKREGGHPTVVALAALFHELPDAKFFDADKMLTLINQWMADFQMDSVIADQVVEIISNLGFSKGLDGASSKSIEFDIVQDADRLEALGAIGIARTFSYGASKNRPFFDETIFPVIHSDSKSYRSSQSPSINHFFEKLFLLKDTMRTTTGKALAVERHQLMWAYLDGFFKEYTFNNPSNEAKWLALLDEHKV